MSRQLLIIVLALAVAVVAQQTSNASYENQTHSQPHRIHVSGGVIIGLVERRTLPEYPGAAIKAGLKGDVISKSSLMKPGRSY